MKLQIVLALQIYKRFVRVSSKFCQRGSNSDNVFFFADEDPNAYTTTSRSSFTDRDPLSPWIGACPNVCIRLKHCLISILLAANGSRGYFSFTFGLYNR